MILRKWNTNKKNTRGQYDHGYFSMALPVVWHTGDPETDSWEWRMRVLEERDDIAYGKFFFGTSGYITREWYPYFLAVRRLGVTFEEWYQEGKGYQEVYRVKETHVLAR